MTEELITFETALLAKEKGFDIPVLYGVYGYKMKLTSEKSGTLINWNTKSKQQKHSKATSVPTQSLLQKWLREKHIIDTNPICNYHHQKGRMYHAGIIFINAKGEVDIIIIPETDKSLDTIHRYYESYEKAIEEALQEALKLIK
jgi:hypothetical protein